METIAGQLQREIAEHGSISFERFMDVALYHPTLGYYRKARDPFGVRGDFVTASQVQPLFGQIIASEAARLGDGRVFELGCGKREMELAFADYTGIDVGDPLPDDLSGFVFANEFFDALPVVAAVRRAGLTKECRVTFADGAFAWLEGPEIASVRALAIEEGQRFEMGLRALEWIDTLAARMTFGSVLIIDYGYRDAELLRFPQGTLMSYRGHRASGDVLHDPGERDITAHVAFDPLMERARSLGFRVESFETLASLVLRAVEANPALVASLRAREQLKTLLYGMGESFHALLLRR